MVGVVVVIEVIVMVVVCRLAHKSTNQNQPKHRPSNNQQGSIKVENDDVKNKVQDETNEE